MSRLVRVTVNIETGRVDWTPLVTDPDLNLEFPVISPKGIGHSSGYTYASYSDVRCGPDERSTNSGERASSL